MKRFCEHIRALLSPGKILFQFFRMLPSIVCVLLMTLSARAAIVIYEDFSSTPSNFTQVSGGTWSTSGGRLQLTSPATGGTALLGNIMVCDTELDDDYLVSGVVQTVGTVNEWNDAALVFGYQDINNHYYVILNETDNDNTHGIFKVVNGAATQLANISTTVYSDTDYEIEVERIGSSIVVKLDDVQVASITDSTFTGGQFGFGSKNDECLFDDLIVDDFRTPVIDEDFSTSAANFDEVLGGTWNVSSGRYLLTSPATGGTALLGNISVHDTALAGDYSISGLIRAVGTTNEWNDTALVFGYQNADNHYYAILNETNNENTHGLFKVVAGTPTELADFNSVTFTSDTDYDIEVIRTGSSIVVELNGSQIASTTDSTFSGGKVGFGSKNDACQFDNLIAFGTEAALVVEDPEFSPTGGTYSTTQSVSISCSTSGASIRYTTNGTTPTATTGTIYTSPISISSTTTLKAIAFKSGLSDSGVVSETYTIIPAGYYVDPSTGSMSNPGTYSQPWSTLEAVFTAGKTFSPGDVIYLRDGNHGMPVITNSNTGDVTITSQSGHDPRLERIYFDSAEHWVLDGVTIHDGGSLPFTPNPKTTNLGPKTGNFLLQILDYSSNITVQNCYLYSHDDTTIASWDDYDWDNYCWNGIDVLDSSNVLIESCDIRNIRFGIRVLRSTSNVMRDCFIENYAGDGIKFDSDDNTIEYCWIQNAYDVNGNHDDGIQLTENSSGGIIRGNMIISYTDANQPYKSNLQAIAGFKGPYEEFLIENNITISDNLYGIALFSAVNSVIVNNTCVDNPIDAFTTNNWAASMVVVTGNSGQAPYGNQIRNNLTHRYDIATGAGTIADNITIGTFTDYFVDFNNFDMHLKSTATDAIDQGDPTYAPSDDWDGDTRDANPDIGADEY